MEDGSVRERPDVGLEEVSAWTADALGAAAQEVLWESGHLSQVLGIRLMDGRDVVVKLRLWEDRLASCAAVHRRMRERGIPCPELLADGRWGDLAVSAESLVAGADQVVAPELGDATRFASRLRDLLDATQGLRVDGPVPPWADCWRIPPGAPLWPEPDDVAVDLNGLPRDWIDEVADLVVASLAQWDRPAVVGHVDWYGLNLAWRGDDLLAVYDLDSLAMLPEAVVAGLASAVWVGVGGWGDVSTVAQSEAFLDAFAARSGWAAADRAAAWAAGLWVRCFDAKKTVVWGADPEMVLSRADAEVRLQLAGLR